MKRDAALQLLNKLRTQSPEDLLSVLDRVTDYWRQQDEELDEEQEKMFRRQFTKVASAIKQRLQKQVKVNPKDQSDFTGASKILGTKTGKDDGVKPTPTVDTPKSEQPQSRELPKQPTVDLGKLQVSLATKLKELSPGIVELRNSKNVPQSAKQSQKEAVEEAGSLVQLAKSGGTQAELEKGLERAGLLQGKIESCKQAIADGWRLELTTVYDPLREQATAVVKGQPPRKALAAQAAVKSDQDAIEQALAGTDQQAIRDATKLAHGLAQKIADFEQIRLLALRETLDLAIQTMLDEIRRVLAIQDPGPEAVKVQEKLRLDVTAIREAAKGEDFGAMVRVLPAVRGLVGTIEQFDKLKVEPKTTTQPVPTKTGGEIKDENTVEARNQRISDKVAAFGKLSPQDKQKQLSQTCIAINKPGNEKLLANAGVEKYVEYMLSFASKNPREPHEQKAMLKLYGVMKLDESFMQDDRNRRDEILTGIEGNPATKNARAGWKNGAGLSNNKTKQSQLQGIQKIQTDVLGFKPGTMMFGMDLNGSSGQCSGKAVHFCDDDSLNEDFDEVLNTLVHETTHAYQNELSEKFNSDLTPKDPGFASDPRFAQAMLFALNNKPGMYAKPPPQSDPKGQLDDKAWKESDEYKLMRRAYDNEPVEAHAWKAGNEAGRMFDRKAQTLKLIPALKAIRECGLADGDPRLAEIIKGVKGTISDQASALDTADAFAQEVGKKLQEEYKRLSAKIKNARDQIGTTRVSEWNEANNIVNEMIDNYNKAIVHSNKKRWLEAAPLYVKAYTTGKNAEANY